MREELERLRGRAALRLWLSAAAALAAAAAVMIGSFAGDGPKWYYYPPTPVAVGVLAGIGLYLLLRRYWYRPAFERFGAAYHSYMIREGLSSVLEDLQYQPKQGFGSAALEDTGLIRFGNVFRSGHYVLGRYRSVQFEQSDVVSGDFQKGGHGAAGKAETFFDGKWMAFDFGAALDGFVCIRQRTFTDVAKPFKLYYSEAGGSEKVELEDREFLREFDVYARDEADAARLLTPGAVAAIRALRDYERGQLLIGLCGGRLHIAVNCGEDFVRADVKRAVNEASTQKVIGEIRLVTALADAFAQTAHIR